MKAGRVASVVPMTMRDGHAAIRPLGVVRTARENVVRRQHASVNICQAGGGAGFVGTLV